MVTLIGEPLVISECEMGSWDFGISDLGPRGIYPKLVLPFLLDSSLASHVFFPEQLYGVVAHIET
jgi:hypothetical protein